MKEFAIGVLTGLLLITAFSFQFHPKEYGYPDKEWIIESKYLHLQEGIDKEEARNWIEQYYLPVYREFPGFNALLGEHTGGGLWGANLTKDPSKGDLVIFYIFDSKKTKEFYFPEDGPWHELVLKAADKYPIIEEFFEKYVDKDQYQMNEYTIFASAKQ